jgi:hypothetical protein
MTRTARNHCDTARSDQMLGSLDVHQDLSLEHDKSLVLVRVGVKRSRLAFWHPVLEQHERPVGLLGSRLHGPHASTGKPAAFSLSILTDDRHCSAHYSPLLSRAFRALDS